MAALKRTLTPEILDSLSPEDPAARRSRRDLRVFNAVLGGERWLRHTLPSRVRRGERVLEIGAGTGELGAGLARAGLAIDGLDRAPRPAAWPAAARWHQADALAFDGWRDYQVVVGNLIFHHFDADALRVLGQRMAAHARVIVACELTRRKIFQRLFAALCVLVRANDVSRHDGRVSIEAGFLGDELPMLLGLDPKTWRWQVTTTFCGTYLLVAQRRE
jgi:SAM-dependent methyltransferase